MTTYTKGMDAAAIQRSGTALRGMADEVDMVRGAGRNAVLRIGQAWQGDDADQFQRDWVQIAAALTGLSDSIGRFAGVLDANVQAQLGASGSDGGLSGSGGHSAGAGIPPVFHKMPAYASPDPEPSFADSVRGTDPLPIDRDLLEMSSQSYEDDPADVNGFTPLTEEELEEIGIDPERIDNSPGDGFGATIYRNEDGQYVVAFRGSDGTDFQLTDWAQDVGQGLGLPMPQYIQAVELATAMHDQFGDDVIFTGHSLGGGLATVAAAATGAPAVTFNSAGVVETQLLAAAAEQHGFLWPWQSGEIRDELANGQMRAYQVESEILTGLQEDGWMPFLPGADGTPIVLDNGAGEGALPWWNPTGGPTIDPGYLHTTQPAEEAMDRAIEIGLFEN